MMWWMRALQITSIDGPSGMATAEIEPPVRGESEVLISVHAAGVAYPDLLLSIGSYQYKPDLPFVPGSEVAGIVLEAPAGSGLEPGMRVAAYTHLGGYQEITVAPADQVFPIPDNLSFIAAAALPINYLTAHFALCTRGRLSPGETVLVHGAGGGLGVACIQLARALGATVIAVVSDEAKASVAQQAGAHHVIPVEGFLAAAKELTGGRGVDIVADPVGGDRVTDSLRSLAPLGRLLVLGFTGGDIPSIKVNRLLLNNVDAIGVGWGAYAMAHDGFMQEQWSEILPLLESKAFTPLVTIESTLETVPAVLQAMHTRTLAGKAVAVLQ
jgi:NADPH2:quinone reductase